MVMLAKGNRSPAVREACQSRAGFYLASIGGAAANVGRALHQEGRDRGNMPSSGMEAIWRHRGGKNFPGLHVIDEQGE